LSLNKESKKKGQSLIRFYQQLVRSAKPRYKWRPTWGVRNSIILTLVDRGAENEILREVIGDLYPLRFA